jgi:RHS repeat-associated protein
MCKPIKYLINHRYLYAGANIVAIYDNDTDELLATLLHEEDAIDSPLSIHLHPKDALTTEEQSYFDTLSEDEQFLFNQSRIKRYYYHRDHQNSIIALSDHNAQIVEYYEYDIYGNITKSEQAEGIQTLNPYRYTGREYDTPDLYYYRARYYDPTIGRFITPDPIGFLSGDTNFYRYVGNDPVNFVDPSGLIVNMAGALAQLASINREHSDGNPFNGIVPDTSVPKTSIPNSTMPKGKTTAQASKPKAAQATSKTA